MKGYFGKTRNPDQPFEIVKIDTLEQKADIFTKGLSEVAFLSIRKLLCNY